MPSTAGVSPRTAPSSRAPPGNTGIGIAHLALARGYRCVIVMPDNQSPEKYALLRTLGVELQIVKAVPYSDPNHYQKVAARVAGEIPGGFWANQFDNTANRDAHFRTTGPEIWRETSGHIDAFVSSSGHRRHAGRRGPLPEVAAQRGAYRGPRISQGSSLYSYFSRGGADGDGSGLDHRGHRHRPHHRQPRRCTHRCRGARH